MSNFNFVILYVDDPLASAAFYTAFFGWPTLEAAPTFAMLATSSGCNLGLWSRHTVEPAAKAAGGGGELAFALANNEAVLELHADWRSRGMKFAQVPTAMDFGLAFVALDLDGHRLRVFSPSAS